MKHTWEGSSEITIKAYIMERGDVFEESHKTKFKLHTNVIPTHPCCQSHAGTVDISLFCKTCPNTMLAVPGV
jgi:hypothetical protein